MVQVSRLLCGRLMLRASLAVVLFVAFGPASDARSETTATIWRDGRTVVVNGVQYDPIQVCGVPAVGEPVVRSVTVSGQLVTVVYGKHSFAEIDAATGEIRCAGSD